MALTPAIQAEDDFQYWSQYSLKMIDTEKIDWSIYTEGRFYNDAKDVGLYLVSQKIKYDFFKHLSLGTNYTYLQFKTNNTVASRSEFKYQHRAELEINPHWSFGDVLKFDSRNRVEFRWIEDKGSYNTRSRHRLNFTFPIKNKRFLKGIYANSEFFYNIAENQYDENRSVPIGLNFKLNDKSSLKTFYMIQAKKGTNWSSNQILGTLLSLKF